MNLSQLDYLDQITSDALNQIDSRVGQLSTGERLYVALAANRLDLMPGYTIPQALARLGDDDVAELIARWQYA
ncbi:hypothetical protein DK842_21520 [Chromobacterium phragmitis]|uniref:hypothetical protein n=1 Tax=Chromobacterium phragmitis TaxID=2202141 RepID=UPI000DEC68ED|nr:hypothetical protein [Chromobacterium phragmitis]AXE32262.1 hypothetical protein DK842_21520 [Chromobacterium phragmitis]